MFETEPIADNSCAIKTAANDISEKEDQAQVKDNSIKRHSYCPT